jgi:alkylation response protein AidB-like acyl-CoA dehydrogenase
VEFGFTPSQLQLQQEAAEFFKKEITEDVLKETETSMDLGPASRQLLRKMGQKRWVAPTWPKEVGGMDSSSIDRQIIVEERLYHGGTLVFHGADIAGPVLFRFGSEEQKGKFIPAIAQGEIELAIGYTEPEAGSDLSAIQMRAVKKGNEYIINGQKMFNTFCHFADYHWLLVRTNPDVPRHRGMSLFLVDLKTPGITIRPLWTMMGWRTNEVYYDDVHVHESNLVGVENQGWQQLMAALGYERMAPSGGIKRHFEKFLQYTEETRVRGQTLVDNPIIRQKLAELAIEIEIARLFVFRAAWMLDQGLSPEHESSMSKLFASEARHHLYSAAMDIMGMYGRLREDSKWAKLFGMIQLHYQWSIESRIVAGTNEIQRNIIALRGLGLPRA